MRDIEYLYLYLYILLTPSMQLDEERISVIGRRRREVGGNWIERRRQRQEVRIGERGRRRSTKRWASGA